MVDHLAVAARRDGEEERSATTGRPQGGTASSSCCGPARRGPPAIRFVEASESAPRRWYGAAIGRIGFDGRIDTGIALRSIRLADGVADMRVGASILHSSVPEDEEQETLVKA